MDSVFYAKVPKLLYILSQTLLCSNHYEKVRIANAAFSLT